MLQLNRRNMHVIRLRFWPIREKTGPITVKRNVSAIMENAGPEAFLVDPIIAQFAYFEVTI